MSRLDERQRRWLAAVDANRSGHGGTEQMRTMPGLDINTIRWGRHELASEFATNPVGRIRAEGGGLRPIASGKSQNFYLSTLVIFRIFLVIFRTF